MRRVTLTAVGIVAIAASAGVVLRADVRTEQKTHVTFAGALGRMVNMFGGKAAKEGLVQTVAVKGDRKLTTTDKAAQLIDLAEEKVYDINLSDKSYTIVTFAQMRQKMQEAQAKMKENSEKMKEHSDKPAEPQKKMAVDVSTKDTGQKKTIAGFDCHESITTVTIREDGKTLEESGGMVITSDSWLTTAIPAMKEIAAFDRRYFEKISGMDPAQMAQQMGQAMAMYPMLREAMGRVRSEGTKVNGTPISTVMTVESVASPEEKQQADQQQQDTSNAGGIGGFLAKKMMKKKQAEGAEPAGAPGHSPVMTSTLDVLSVATDVSADAVSIPAGFKEKK